MTKQIPSVDEKHSLFCNFVYSSYLVTVQPFANNTSSNRKLICEREWAARAKIEYKMRFDLDLMCTSFNNKAKLNPTISLEVYGWRKISSNKTSSNRPFSPFLLSNYKIDMSTL